MLKTGTTQIQTQKRKRIPGAETSVSARGGGGSAWGGGWGGGGVRGAQRRALGRGLAATKAGEGGFCYRARPSSWGGWPLLGSRPRRRSEPGVERSRGALAAPGEGGAHSELTPQGPPTPSPRSHWPPQSGGTGSPGISVRSDPTSRSPQRSR